MFTATRLTQALFVAGATLIAGSAYADAYAVATDNIRNGAVTPSSANITFGRPLSNSSSSASLNGVGVSFASATFNPDSPVSALGSAAGRPNELGVPYYTLYGDNGTDYSWGDAIVNQEQTPLLPIRARNGAESNIAINGFANSDGTNKSSTLVTVGNCAGGCTLSFAFEADPYIRAAVDALASSDSVARGTLGFTITVTNANTHATVFSWSPNGAAGGIFGGTEFADAENLNLTLAAFAGDNLTHSAPYGAGTFGFYSAMTDVLAPGKYTLSLFQNEKSDVIRAPIPEPETYALMLAGLGAMGFVARRRKS